MSIIGKPLFIPAAAVTPATASLTPQSGVTYTDGISGIDPATLSVLCEAISDNASITSNTLLVYVDYKKIHRKISVADQVVISLNGTDYAFDVIGFNHDHLSSPSAYSKITTTTRAGMTLQMHDLFATIYAMNSSNTNVGGWKSSAMRTSTMVTMKGYMPTAWQSVIKSVDKDSGKGGGSSSGVEVTSDDCFLLAEKEVFGSTGLSVSGEGTQYAYYKAGNSKVKNKGGSANTWWGRSPRRGDSNSFCRVSSNGTSNLHGASAISGVAFGFCV